jgi:hypothetical protein
MSGLHVQLSQHEEITLRRVAQAATARLAPAHIQRLRQLRLIQANGTSWRLTELGRQRVGALPQPVKLLTGDAFSEIERILAKYAMQVGKDP